MGDTDLQAEFAGVGRVLLLGPTLGDGSQRDVCHSLLRDPSGGCLQVSLVRSADQVLDEWRATESGVPPDLAIVTVDSGRGAPGTADGTVDGVRVEHVSSASDLTGLGIAITQCLEGFEGESAAVCFDSLTVLLQYVDAEQAFRFLHVLSRYFDAADATLHVHLDPTTQDDQTLSTLASLFDAMARYEDGEWEVRRS